MKKIIFFAILFFSTTSFSQTNNGFYVGLMGGYGDTNWKDVGYNKDTGVSGGPFIGYNFNKNLATQLEYVYFNPTSASFKTQALALTGKLTVPLYNKINLYTKFGIDHLHSNADHQSNYNLTYGIGAEYQLTPNIGTGLSWTRYYGEHSVNTPNVIYQPNADLYALNVTYKFGNFDNDNRNLSTNFSTQDSGLYLGIMGGYNYISWKDWAGQIHSFYCGEDYTLKVQNNTGFAIGPLVGYDFNPYLALQTEYLYLGNQVAMIGDGLHDNTNPPKYQDNPTLWTAKTQIAAVLGKFKLPITDKINVYSKFGVDYLYTKFNSTFINNIQYSGTHRSTFSLAYGLGIEGKMTSHTIIGFSWMRYNGNSDFTGNNAVFKNYQPSVDLYVISIAYKF